MSKAERRKRARARAKERQGTQPNGADRGVTEGPTYLDPTTGAVESLAGGRQVLVTEVGRAGGGGSASSMADDTSGYITGPIVPAGPRSVVPTRRAVRLDLPATVQVPRAEQDDGPEDEGDEDDGPDNDDDDDDDVLVDGEDDDEEGDEDDDETSDDGDDGDEGDDAPEEEALFNVACAAVEQGDALSWNEVIHNLCIAEIEDPRLGLLVALLVEGENGPEKLTGERLLTVLRDIGLGDIVDEAREVTTLAPRELGDAPEDRAVVRTNARELKEQAATELGPVVGGKKGGKHRPVRASDIRAQRSSLSAPGLLGSVSGSPKR